jgi:eukaryotic-like serine/threonine-protein kinase
MDDVRLRGGAARYRLVKCIARGGMGSVYLGVQIGAPGFERLVAIKRTHPHLLETPGMRQLILQEARNAAAVRHPNVVSIDDVEEIGGELLLVMDYVEGSSLSQLRRGGPIPIGIALAAALDACAGLGAIHAARGADGWPLGLVHRDISPQNILVGVNGSARVTDFGIAKAAADPIRTGKTMRRGKVGYMAPEYLVEGAATMGTDIFALGVVLWEVLAGRRLFSADTQEDAMRLTIEAKVPRLHAENPSIPAALDAIVRRALARESEYRFQTVADFSSYLRDVSRGLVASTAEVGAFVAERIAQAKVAAGSAPNVDTPEAELARPPATARPVAEDTQLTPRRHRAFRIEDHPRLSPLRR